MFFLHYHINTYQASSFAEKACYMYHFFILKKRVKLEAITRFSARLANSFDKEATFIFIDDFSLNMQQKKGIKPGIGHIEHFLAATHTHEAAYTKGCTNSNCRQFVR